jgi:hypothetical protein
MAKPSEELITWCVAEKGMPVNPNFFGNTGVKKWSIDYRINT